jgi:ankyrin repeat protein
MTKLLIELGADVNIEDNHKQTPLFYAAKNGKIEICGILIDSGAHINHEDDK